MVSDLTTEDKKHLISLIDGELEDLESEVRFDRLFEEDEKSADEAPARESIAIYSAIRDKLDE